MPSYSGVWNINEVFQAVAQNIWTNVTARGLVSGGSGTDGQPINVIQYINLTTATGNAADFGDLLSNSYQTSSCGSSTRGVIMGGYSTSVPGSWNVIQYVSFDSTGNATDFGDLTMISSQGAGCNSGTRGLTAIATSTSGTSVNVLEYITIASVGNSTDFGDMTSASVSMYSCSSPTRGLFCATGPGPQNLIDYVTIASTGNAANFGALDIGFATSRLGAAVSSSTRAVFAIGAISGATGNVLQYVTIATTGNALDFGDLSGVVNALAGMSSSVKGFFAGGDTNGSAATAKNVIDVITIATTGNSTDFGDLLAAYNNVNGCSNANGGVQ